jgi:hypothetical protein
MASSAPVRGSVTFSSSGKLFFKANLGGRDDMTTRQFWAGMFGRNIRPEYSAGIS